MKRKDLRSQARAASTLSFICFVITFAAVAITAQTPSPTDRRVEEAFRQTGTKFEFNPTTNIYSVTYATTGKRTQLVHIAGGTETLNGVEKRLIFSFATTSDSLPTQAIATTLLQENMEKVGTWALQKLDNKQFAIVSILYVPADIKPADMENSIMAIASLADEMEDRLTKKDVN